MEKFDNRKYNKNEDGKSPKEYFNLKNLEKKEEILEKIGPVNFSTYELLYEAIQYNSHFAIEKIINNNIDVSKLIKEDNLINEISDNNLEKLINAGCIDEGTLSYIKFIRTGDEQHLDRYLDLNIEIVINNLEGLLNKRIYGDFLSTKMRRQFPGHSYYDYKDINLEDSSYESKYVKVVVSQKNITDFVVRNKKEILEKKNVFTLAVAYRLTQDNDFLNLAENLTKKQEIEKTGKKSFFRDDFTWIPDYYKASGDEFAGKSAEYYLKLYEETKDNKYLKSAEENILILSNLYNRTDYKYVDEIYPNLREELNNLQKKLKNFKDQKEEVYEKMEESKLAKIIIEKEKKFLPWDLKKSKPEENSFIHDRDELYKELEKVNGDKNQVQFFERRKKEASKDALYTLPKYSSLYKQIPHYINNGEFNKAQQIVRDTVYFENIFFNEAIKRNDFSSCFNMCFNVLNYKKNNDIPVFGNKNPKSNLYSESDVEYVKKRLLSRDILENFTYEQLEKINESLENKLAPIKESIRFEVSERVYKILEEKISLLSEDCNLRDTVFIELDHNISSFDRYSYFLKNARDTQKVVIISALPVDYFNNIYNGENKNMKFEHLLENKYIKFIDMHDIGNIEKVQYIFD